MTIEQECKNERGIAKYFSGQLQIVHDIVGGTHTAGDAGNRASGFQLVQAFRSESGGRAIWRFLVGLLYIAGGIYLLVHPTLGLIGLTLVMAVFFFSEGVIELANYISTRGRSDSKWLLLHGIASLLLGLVIWRRWPISSFWTIGILVGIGMIMTGVTRLMMALSLRKTQQA